MNKPAKDVKRRLSACSFGKGLIIFEFSEYVCYNIDTVFQGAIFMEYTLEQVKQLVTDTAIKANWMNFAFSRRLHEIEVSFGTQLIEGIQLIGADYFYITFSCEQCNSDKDIHYYIYEDYVRPEVTEQQWFETLNSYFIRYCNVDLEYDPWRFREDD